MSFAGNNISNMFLKAYMAQAKKSLNNDGKLSNDTESFNKEMQTIAFEMMLNQMMESSGNSMMKEYLTTALTQQDSLSSSYGLETLSNYNSFMRNNNYNDTYLQAYTKGMDTDFSGLGIKASKYESNVNPGTISNTPGDYGGKSYGAWQFSAKTGSLNDFINWLKDNNGEFASKLLKAKSKDGNKFGKNFDAEWTSIASNNREQFMKAQQGYVKGHYYDKVAQTLKSKFGFDINTRSNALKESLWSTVVQHGTGGASAIFSKLNLNNSDANIINDLYNERQKVNIYFRSSSDRVKQSVYNRFTREKQDMLSMLKEEFI
ncbi:vgrg protein [Clostridium sp. MB40-C1]|uniref:VgrG-related protein n=1 Tax=Clostridium sp. MB40-C1 TaxID=3070996 RepID=UPI0027E07750|nr:vgrg protein [Clostridium sp. MB40-C1]WMJ79296.1 vgrg protein [Clostridium sp. MB40-C1]